MTDQILRSLARAGPPKVGILQLVLGVLTTKWSSPMIMFELVFQIPEHHLRKLGIIQLSISIEVSLSKSIIMIIHPIPIALRLFFMETSPLLTAPLLLLNSAYCAHSPSLPGEKSNWVEAFIVVLQRLPDKIYGHRVYGWSPLCKPQNMSV